MAIKSDGISKARPPVIVNWAERIRSSSDWRRFAIALLSGAASVLALAPFFFWPILFMTLPHLVWLTDGVEEDQPWRARFGSAALNGWLFGFGYFSAGLFWVGEAFLAQATEFLWALPFAVTLLPAGLALFFAAGVGLAKLCWRQGISRVIALSVLLTCFEWLRGHVLTGFPWNTLGYALTAPLPLLQTVALVGVYGMTMWVVVIAALPAVVAADGARGERRTIRIWGGAIAAACLIAAFWVHGQLRLSASPLTYADDVRIRIVQASIPQHEKWVPANRERIFASLLDLSGKNAKGEVDNLKGVTHVVWSEVAMPFLPLEIPEVMQRIGAMLPAGTHLITGGLRREPPRADSNQRAFNSMLVFDDAGKPVLMYDKIHLVPFGEYLPFQKTMESIGLRQLVKMRGGFASGITPRPLLNIGKLKNAAGLICYEAIFPGEVSAGKMPSDRPSLFINLTNDAWFGNTTGPRQHFHQARARAVETGVPLLRAANNGISALIGPAGRVEDRLDLNHKGTLDVRVPHVLPAPLYARFGDWILLMQLVFTSLLAAILARRIA